MRREGRVADGPDYADRGCAAAGASAGAIDGLKDNASQAAKAAYGKLHGLVRRPRRGNASAELILTETGRPGDLAAPLAKKLGECGREEDGDLVAAARALMELVDKAGVSAGKYNVTIHGGRGVQVGDGNIQVNEF